jgi:hypothetical protein
MSSEKKKPYGQVLDEMIAKQKEDQKTEKAYCEKCGNFLGSSQKCRGGKYPSTDITYCDKHPK